MHVRRVLRTVTLLILIASTSPLFAQTSSARLTGKVIDAENGTPLAGATVSTTDRSVRSDAEGNFFLPIDRTRTYSVTVTSVGYSPKVIGGVHVEGDQLPVLQVALQHTNKELEAVTVRASTRREAQASLYNVQKNSSSISDGISAEVIRKSPDRNTGDVLKRVSGASVQDNKFVVIRGLSERYNASLLNNSVLPSTEPDKKAFAFDIIPSSVIDNLVIYKSATPDLPGDFSGGAIKVNTKDYPAQNLSELSVSIGYNSMTTGKNFYRTRGNGDFDQLGFLDNKSRLMPGAYYNNRYGFINNSESFKSSVTKLFPNTYGYEVANRSMPNVSASYTGGNTAIHSNGTKLGYIYSVGYSNGRSVGDRDRLDFEITKRQLYDYRTTNYDERNNLSALLNLTYSYGRSKISWKNLFNNTFVKTAALRSGINTENDQDNFFYIKSANAEVTQNGLANSVLEGLHRIGKDWTVDWNGSFAYTYRNQPDQRILTFRSADNLNSGYTVTLNNENSPEIRNAGRVYAYLNEYIYGASANATKQFTLFDRVQKLKFGTQNYYRDRNVEVDGIGYASFNGRTVIAETKTTTFNNLFSPENIDQYRLTLANIETNSAKYTGNALLTAGYAMLDNKFSEKIKLTWGVRVEKYRQELSARNRATKVYDNTDVLPSLLLTYAVTNNANIRLAGSQAVNRPEFRELADYNVYDYDNNVAVRGNTGLVRCRNTNADLRYEWFPAAGEIISASLFYKYFENPIEQVNKGNDVLSYQNADHASAYGVELELRKKLDFLSAKFFENLTFYANAAYIKGSVQFSGVEVNSPLQGQSPYLVNAGLNYTTPGEFSVNVLYNRIGPRLKFRAISGAALNIFEKPRDLIDLQISQKFLNKRLEVRLTISDLLAQPFTWYYKYDPKLSNTNYKASEDKIINTMKYGTTGTLAIRYSFGK